LGNLRNGVKTAYYEEEVLFFMYIFLSQAIWVFIKKNPKYNNIKYMETIIYLYYLRIIFNKLFYFYGRNLYFIILKNLIIKCTLSKF